MKKKKLTSNTNGGIVIGVLLGMAIAAGASEVSQFLWGENVGTFIKGIAKNSSTVGALTPCSCFVAQDCVCELSEHDGVKRILEVGAGSGAVTREIVKHIGEDDRLDLVEISPEYARSLQRQFGDLENVHINCCDVLNLNVDEKYDYIISTLPFTSLPIKVVRAVLKRYSEIIKPSGSIVYVECNGAAMFRKSFLQLRKSIFDSDDARRKLKNFKEKRKVIKEFRKKHYVKKSREILNIPPITVYHMKTEGQS